MVLPVFEGKSKTRFIFLMLGIFACLLAGEINGRILYYSDFSNYYLTINIAPAVEELLKAIPVFIFAFAFKPNRQLLLECSLATGIGFALLENTFILSSSSSSSIMIALMRGLGAGMLHGLCTFAIGYGLTLVRKYKAFYICGNIALISLAIIYHSIYNIIVQSDYQLFAIILPLITFIPFVTVVMIKRKNRKETDK